MLRTILILAAGATAFAAPAAQPGQSRVEAQIERNLRGLIPGPPQACITASRSQGSLHDGNTLLIRDQQNVQYLTHFRGGCEIPARAALIRRSTSTRTCAGEIVLGEDLVSGAPLAGCSYGEFVPYRKPR